MAATNRADLLDAALLRPGRFDRTIAVPPPDRRGRTRILELVGRRHDFGSDVDFVALARRTPGMTGADLAALVNEAALEATRSGVGVITAKHLESALGTTVLGPGTPFGGDQPGATAASARGTRPGTRCAPSSSPTPTIPCRSRSFPGAAPAARPGWWRATTCS